MGSLRNKRIVQSRIWLDDSYASPLPSYDYDFSYPITVYDAVRKNLEENSTTLTDEIAAIYRLIAEKQPIIGAGTPGQLMTWSGIAGLIGSTEIVQTLANSVIEGSSAKVPSERAVLAALERKTPLLDFNLHRDDISIHVTSAEKTKWNAMAPLASLSAHIGNATMHITNAERTRWNAKADADIVDAHIYDYNNPHRVSAHQVNTYTRAEIDELIQGIHESFFNYLNIEYNPQTDEAELVAYDEINWNPNFVLSNDASLPNVSNLDNTYFALRPATDYTINETNQCVIYIKTPGIAWREIGTAQMSPGDMVITYPDTVMYVWISGRFVSLFSGSSGSGPVTADDGGLWYPVVASDGTLSWIMSYSSSVPTPVNIKGEDGYTPVKGVDYVDGADGVGVPLGGDVNDLLVKLSMDNYNTTWRSIGDVLNDWILAGNTLPQGTVEWSSIANKPEWYEEFGENSDGFITQDVITARFTALDNDLSELSSDIYSLKESRDEFNAHLVDWNNPHNTTPAKIGAVSLGDFTSHTTDFNNPHNVTKAQLGLTNVDNTSDIDKPISTATQTALNAIYDALGGLDTSLGGVNYIKSIAWDNENSSLLLTFKDNSTTSVVIPLQNLQVEFDSSTNELVFIQPNGDTVRLDVSRLIPVYTGSDSANIHTVIENDNAIKSTLIPGTVGEYEIAPSVHLRNSPTTTTQVVSDRSTKIATTEFVASQTVNNLVSYDTDRPLSANMGRILNQEKVSEEQVRDMINNVTVVEVLDELGSTNQTAALSANMGRYLNLTKAPRVHTSPDGATFGIATISLFGHTRASEVDPEMDGTVFRGTDNGRYARADHRHPTDITRASVADIDGHKDADIASETGVHNFRFYNNSLDYKNPNGDWVSVFGYLRKPGTAYLKGDVIQDLNLPKWAELECDYPGTTGNGTLTVPTKTIGSYTGVCIGDYIEDGTVKWVIRAKRTQMMLDVPVPFRGDFATVNATGGNYQVPIHKELEIPMLDCRFCDGSNGTIDMRNRFIMGKNAIADYDANGGSDTVTLTKAMLPKDEYNLGSLSGSVGSKTNLTTVSKSGVSISTTVSISSLSGSTSSDGAHTHSINWNGFIPRGNWPGDYYQGTVDTTTPVGFIPAISNISIESAGAHTHSFSNVTGSGSGSGSLTIPSLSVNDHTHTVTINNGNDIKFKLNTATTQSTFSVVSKHYKLAYIQRIY